MPDEPHGSPQKGTPGFPLATPRLFLHGGRMNGPASASAPPERFFESPMRGWEWLFLGLLTLCLLGASWAQSHREYLGHDELFTAILVSNPNYGEMVQTIRHGGELNPPLYFSIEWVVARLLGTGDFALRSVSTVSVVLAS